MCGDNVIIKCNRGDDYLDEDLDLERERETDLDLEGDRDLE